MMYGTNRAETYNFKINKDSFNIFLSYDDNIIYNTIFLYLLNNGCNQDFASEIARISSEKVLKTKITDKYTTIYDDSNLVVKCRRIQ